MFEIFILITLLGACLSQCLLPADKDRRTGEQKGRKASGPELQRRSRKNHHDRQNTSRKRNVKNQAHLLAAALLNSFDGTGRLK